MSSQGASLSEEEILALSQDCKYVRKQVKRGLIRKDDSVNVKKLRKAERKERKRAQILANDPSWEYKRSEKERTSKKEMNQKVNKRYAKSYEEIVFFRNDFLVSLLKVTPCFKGETKEEIIKLFGSPFRNCEGCLKERVEYNFHIEDGKFETISFRFKEDRVTRIQVFRGTRIEIY